MNQYSPEEIEVALAQLQELYGVDDPAYQEFMMIMTGGKELEKLEKTHEPVSVEEFLEDPYFMGGVMDELWPKTIESVKEVISGGFVEAVFDGCLNRAKTTRATIITAYNLYRLSTYVNPQKTLGLMSNSDIYIALINKTLRLATRATYKPFRELIASIPYFRENFMFDETVESEMRFPNKIFVIPSNADNKTLMGLDIVTAIVDEINFYDRVTKSKRSDDGKEYDQAIVIYNGIMRRIRSRFEGLPVNLRGCVSVVSSRSHAGDFTDVKLKEIEQDRVAGKVILSYVSTGSYWTFAPQYRSDGTQRYSDETFLVAIGNKKEKSEIIKHISLKGDRQVIEVPLNFKPEFEHDINGALRDIGGVVSRASSSYFTDPDVITRSIENFNDLNRQRIFIEESWDLADGLPEINPNYKPYNEDVKRFIHLDLSKTGDNTGIGIAHSVYDSKKRVRRSQDFTDFEPYPIIEFDDFIAIEPPKNGEIDYSLIRKLLYTLHNKIGLKIGWVSADSYQSKDMLSILGKKLICETTTISVESEESYDLLKNAFIEDRVIMPNHELMIDELLHVVKESSGNINHLPGRSKDVCDTAAGCYKNMLRVYESGKLYLSGRSNLANLYNRSR